MTNRIVVARAMFGASALASCVLYGLVEPTTSKAVPIGPDCPALYILAVQGTGQSSPTADPTADTGLVGAVLGPVVAAAPNLVQRSYIGYSAAFGGAVPGGGPEPYVESVAEARARLTAAATEVAAACPNTMLAAVGYSQGAQAVSGFAQQVGAGQGPIPPDRVAAIALYSDPDRPMGAPVIPGRPGQTAPDPAPGTSGDAVAAVRLGPAMVGGGGIAADGAEFGALTGRVAEICAVGDLACSAPDRAALLRLGAQIAAQADLRNPLAALGSLNAILADTLGSAWTTMLAEDFQTTGGTVDYLPRKTLAQRLIDAADPRVAPLSAAQAATAQTQWTHITAAVTANPIAVLPTLTGQLAAAWNQLVADNADLSNPAVWAAYAGTASAHTGYASAGALASGIAWLIALAHDTAGSHHDRQLADH
ncbi:cutinase family protein [Nocardia sp. CDC159]|uniref:Cutinase family protein n=1 Tax=Nocardia pulmonis TaxID=2951408 RepID=A0A9X2E688_9NOCA|nr:MULTISPECIES: cutinase family protein [Nocardia]MCM6774411.1 cutinase family protein [Nocardia pulmonis]MCM6787523.1 cutinase family protein [Nocardia sp. CDC159]